MKHWIYICQNCLSEHATERMLSRCPACNGLLDLEQKRETQVWQVDLTQPGLWRYRSLLPVEPDQDIITLGEGMTPLHQINYAGIRLWLKHDYLCPTGSYKDRGAAVLVNRASSRGVRSGVEDSSGNAGCAIAAYCALAGMSCQIYVPAGTSPNKLRQIEAYGADIIKISGTRQDTSDAVKHAAKTSTYLSHIYDPHFYQGTKTIAFELYEQMQGNLPDQIILPVGHGTLLIGIWHGFSQLMELGLITHIPELIAVQAAACAPLYAAWSGSETPSSLPTLAEGIAIARPPRLKQMLRAVRESNGRVEIVSESNIADSQSEAWRHGLFIEPTSAVVLAAAVNLSLQGFLAERTVCLLSGHGLKSVC